MKAKKNTTLHISFITFIKNYVTLFLFLLYNYLLLNISIINRYIIYFIIIRFFILFNSP